MSLKVVRPEVVSARTPEEGVRLKNRMRGVLRQTVVQLMKVAPPKEAKDAPRYAAEIGDVWGEGFIEAFDVYLEEYMRNQKEA